MDGLEPSEFKIMLSYMVAMDGLEPSTSAYGPKSECLRSKPAGYIGIFNENLYKKPSLIL